MIYVKIKHLYRIGDEKTLFLLIINLPSLARIACIVLHCLIQVANSHRNNLVPRTCNTLLERP